HVFYGYFGRAASELFRLLESWTARVTDRLVAVSEAEKRESLERGVGWERQWAVIPAAARAEEARPGREELERLRAFHGLSPEELVIGTIARLEPVKGVRSLIEALPAVLAFSRDRASRVRRRPLGLGGASEALRRLRPALPQRGDGARLASGHGTWNSGRRRTGLRHPRVGWRLRSFGRARRLSRPRAVPHPAVGGAGTAPEAFGGGPPSGAPRRRGWTCAPWPRRDAPRP
ncbi:MAG: hypothetical protein FD126_3811, partial [Elusimicrobia bacterium]